MTSEGDQRQMMRNGFDYEKTEPWASGYINPEEKCNFHSRHLRRLLGELEGVNGKVLEIGCGAGRVIRSLKQLRPDLEAYGCDISFTALNKAMSYPEDIDYQQADACQLPYGDEAFAVVIAWDLLEHLHRPRRAIAEIYRILKHGGLVSAIVPCEGNIFTVHNLLKKTSLGKLRHKLHGHVQRLKIDELKKMFLSVGFELRSVRYGLHWIGQTGDVLGDILLSRGYSRHHLWGKKSMKSLLHPSVGFYAILWKLAYYESVLLNRFAPTALSVELTLEKKGQATTEDHS